MYSRLALHVVFGALALLPLSHAAAQSFPERPLRVVIPYPAGGSATVVGRAISTRLSENLAKAVIVDNRGGGGGKIGAEAVAKANPDGYTLLFGETGSMAINASLMDRTGSHPVKDFVAIAQVVTLENVLVAHPSFGVKNLRDMVAKASSGPLIYGSSGAGTVGHLAMELLKNTLNVKATHIPYKGGAPAIADVLGGQIPLLMVTVPTAAPHVHSGKLLPIAALSPRRTAILPNVATVAEQGFPPLSVSQWYGFFAPAGTPKKIVDILNAELRKAVHAPDVTKTLVGVGTDVSTNSPEVFAKIVKDDVERWAVVIREAGIQAN